MPGDVIAAEPQNRMVVLFTSGEKMTWTQTQNYIFSTKDAGTTRISCIPGALTACSRFTSQISSVFHTCATQ